MSWSNYLLPVLMYTSFRIKINTGFIDSNLLNRYELNVLIMYDSNSTCLIKTHVYLSRAPDASRFLFLNSIFGKSVYDSATINVSID